MLKILLLWVLAVLTFAIEIAFVLVVVRFFSIEHLVAFIAVHVFFGINISWITLKFKGKL